MPNFTKTLNLEKPLRGEFYSINKHNENSEKIDLAIEKITVPTIEHLKNMIELQEGDIVDLQGYCAAGDGAQHKRKITANDEGNGVQLSNGLWANRLYNGTYDRSYIFEKNLNKFSKKIELSYLKNNYDFSTWFAQACHIDKDEIVVLMQKSSGTISQFVKFDTKGVFVSKSSEITNTAFSQGLVKYNNNYYIISSEAGKLDKFNSTFTKVGTVQVTSTVSTDLTFDDNCFVTSNFNNVFFNDAETGKLVKSEELKKYRIKQKSQTMFRFAGKTYTAGGQQTTDIRVGEIELDKTNFATKLGFSNTTFEIEGSAVVNGLLNFLIFADDSFYIVENSENGIPIKCSTSYNSMINDSIILASEITGDIIDYVFLNTVPGKTLKIYSEAGKNLSVKNVTIKDYSIIEFLNVNDFTLNMSYYTDNTVYTAKVNKDVSALSFSNIQQFSKNGFIFQKNNQTGMINFRYVGTASNLIAGLADGSLPQAFREPFNIYFPVFYKSANNKTAWVTMENGKFVSVGTLETGDVYVFGTYFNNFFYLENGTYQHATLEEEAWKKL